MEMNADCWGIVYIYDKSKRRYWGDGLMVVWSGYNESN